MYVCSKIMPASRFYVYIKYSVDVFYSIIQSKTNNKEHYIELYDTYKTVYDSALTIITEEKN